MNQILELSINLHHRYDKIKVNGLLTAPLTIPPPAMLFAIDYAEFKKLPGEKDAIKMHKKQLPKTRNYKFTTASKITI